MLFIFRDKEAGSLIPAKVCLDFKISDFSYITSMSSLDGQKIIQGSTLASETFQKIWMNSKVKPHGDESVMRGANLILLKNNLSIIF